MIRKSFFSLFLIVLVALFLFTCRKDKGKVNNGYPEEISKLLVDKCATAGCHTKTSKDVAAGISLETWDDLFAGGNSGAVCIPFSHAYSTLFLFTNTDSSLGAVNIPTMPLNKPALSKEEMKTLTNWIDNGAPNSDGKIMWADNPNRKKFYVANQGCDVVTVFDAATLLQMRYISVGSSAGIESPHMIKISPDGKYWYTCFYAGSALERHRTDDDSFAGKINIGSGSWNTFAISNDSKYAYVVDWNSSGQVAPVNLSTMTALGAWAGLFVWPHGSSINPNGDTVYITCQSGNFIYKVPVNDPGSASSISLDPPNPPTNLAAIEPHDIAWSPDSTMYFITCNKSNDVRVFLRSNDSQIAKIHTGDYPVEIAFSLNPSTPYLFVTCMYDLTPPEKNRGSVTVINYKTLSWVKNIKTNMAEPHGIAIDDEKGLVYVANRNLTGPLPHHSTSCSGRIGFISVVDINTLTSLPKKVEVAVDPYSIMVRK